MLPATGTGRKAGAAELHSETGEGCHFLVLQTTVDARKMHDFRISYLSMLILHATVSISYQKRILAIPWQTYVR